MKAPTENTVGNTSVTTTLNAELATSTGRTANTRKGTAAQAMAAPIGCEKASPSSDSATVMTSGAAPRARRSNKRVAEQKQENRHQHFRRSGDGRAQQGRMKGQQRGCRRPPRKRQARARGTTANQSPASSPARPAASSAGAGAPLGVTNSSAAVARNGSVG